jgi:hypothetical protein
MAIFSVHTASPRPTELLRQYGPATAAQLEVQYTRKHLRLVDDSDPAEYKPDLNVTVSIDAYLHGRDTVLDAAIHHSN